MRTTAGVLGTEPTVDTADRLGVSSSHAGIGELTLGYDFSSGAVGTTGRLSTVAVPPTCPDRCQRRSRDPRAAGAGPASASDRASGT